MATSTSPGRSSDHVSYRAADAIRHEQGGWFDARSHFSFDRHRDPEQLGVGALRVFKHGLAGDADSGRRR